MAVIVITVFMIITLNLLLQRSVKPVLTLRFETRWVKVQGFLCHGGCENSSEGLSEQVSGLPGSVAQT